MSTPENITVAMKLDGASVERGHVLLDDFLFQLHALKDALTCIDKEVHGRTTLAYRVVDLSHSSPATVVLEPVVKQSIRGKQESSLRNAAATVHHRFFHTLEIVRGKAVKPENTSEETIESFTFLVEGLGTRFESGAIFNSKHAVELDSTLQEGLSKITEPSFTSVGSIEGQLLGINFARGNRFYIYPKVGPRSVSCFFDDGLEADAKRYIKRLVRVFGTKQFRPSSGLPFRIDVTRLEGVASPKPLPAKQKATKMHRGEPADQEIARIRNEWD